MTLSGIQDFNGLQSGFPIKIVSGMTICETIMVRKELMQDLLIL